MNYDVAIIGGGLVGSMASVMLQKRGLKTVVLESRPEGKEQKVVVGEAMTEGSSVFLRHELGMTDWLKANAFRKFGFDFVTLPSDRPAPQTMEECHELLLSLTPLEKIPGAFKCLIPTFHVERTSMNAYVAEMARSQGATYLYGASVEQCVFGPTNELHYSEGGAPKVLTCNWVLDCSGRRTVLGRQLGITHARQELPTASVWNRFTNVRGDKEFWGTFHGIDRRKHTIHFTGPGFWFWWIHQSPDMTSVGVSYDRRQHQPNVKAEDHGFAEMVAKFPAVGEALKGARPLEPYQYYAHLPYQSEHWVSDKGYALIGDAAWFTDALYSIGVETACRQLTAVVPMIVDAVSGTPPKPMRIDQLNTQFRYCQDTVLALNKFKYEHAWGKPHLLMQTAVYELAEIAELYNMQDARDWRPDVLARHYKLQWSCKHRQAKLQKFMSDSLKDADRDLGAPLLKKALLPGPLVYAATWPLWNTSRRLVPKFFQLIRGWAYVERAAQRRLGPDALSLMAKSERWLAEKPLAWNLNAERRAS